MLFKLQTILICLMLALFAACQTSNTDEPMTPEMAKNMLKLKGYDPDEPGFFRALKANDAGAVKAFFDAGINPNAKNEKGETALTFAIQNAESKTVRTLLDKADINMRDALGNAPLHLALLKNKEDIFDALMQKNADVNVTGAGNNVKTKNQPVLYLAATRGRDDLMGRLLERGANPNAADGDGATVLSEVCNRSDAKPETVKMLIDKGANVNQPESNGATPLLYIASNKQLSSARRAEIAKMLLAAGADKSLKAKNGKSPLDAAKQMNNTDMVELLK